mmetsp:Transcript_73052/g.107168  ORF Transcript_73052/g.107168 Transcript_73052/m.107168 type:complete len:291 (+) Transcript_73052:1030-1902(+)
MLRASTRLLICTSRLLRPKPLSWVASLSLLVQCVSVSVDFLEEAARRFLRAVLALRPNRQHEGPQIRRRRSVHRSLSSPIAGQSRRLLLRPEMLKCRPKRMSRPESGLSSKLLVKPRLLSVRLSRRPWPPKRKGNKTRLWLLGQRHRLVGRRVPLALRDFRPLAVVSLVVRRLSVLPRSVLLDRSVSLDRSVLPPAVSTPPPMTGLRPWRPRRQNRNRFLRSGRLLSRTRRGSRWSFSPSARPNRRGYVLSRLPSARPLRPVASLLPSSRQLNALQPRQLARRLAVALPW